MVSPSPYSAKSIVATLLLLLNVALTSPAFAQHPIVNLNRLTTTRGLTSNQYTHYTFHDSEGFVWISSVAGLNRFDGYRVRQYKARPDDSLALMSDFASQSQIYEDDGGDLWFGNKSCLARYVRSQDNFRRYRFTLPDGKTADEFYFWAYLDAADQEIYASANRQLFVMSIEDPTQKTWVDSIFVGIKDRMFPLDDARNVLFRQRENCTILERRVYDRHQLVSIDTVALPGATTVGDTWLVDENSALIGTGRGLYLLDLESLRLTALPNDYDGRRVDDITHLAPLKDKQWLIHTEDGELFTYNLHQRRVVDRKWRRKDGSGEPIGGQTVTMTVDRAENFWLCTAGQGVRFASLTKPKFDAHFLNQPSERKNFRALAAAGDGTIYGLLPAEVVRISGRDTTFIPLPIGESYLDDAMEIFVDSRSRVWVGTLSDLLLLEPGESAFRLVDFLPAGSPVARPGYTFVTETPGGDLLIGPNQAGLFIIDGDLTNSAWITPGLKRTAIMAFGRNNEFVHVDFDDALTFGTYRNGKIVRDSVIGDFSFAPSVCYDEGAGVFRIGSSSGLYRAWREDGQWNCVIDGHLGDVSVQAIAVDGEDRVWLATPGGLLRYQEGNGITNRYGVADGLASSDFTFGCGLPLRDGRIILGGGNGLTAFDPTTIKPTVALPRPTITGIAINDDPELAFEYCRKDVRNATLVEVLRLPYALNTLDFQFSAMEYSDPGACRFQYQLLGAENDAVRPVTADPKVSFTNLAEGSYELRLWAWNSDGVKSEQPRTLAITILPPWYRTWWAYALYALALITAALAFQNNRLRSIRKMEREQLRAATAEARAAEAEVVVKKEQLRAATAEAHAAETETSVLRLQMNPHFIFNSLNAVNAFILKGEKMAAHEYLHKFADLIREILNRSAQPFIRLEDATELLEDYMDAERMRVGPNLRYEIDIDPDIDAFSTYIPTMILQPFVENAIWHGIASRPEGGLITLRFRLNEAETQLIAEVEDDGRGRGSAKVGASTKRHASKALGITQRRLDLLNNAPPLSPAPATPPPKAALEIHDLLHPDGSPRGTLVRVYLPLN